MAAGSHGWETPQKKTAQGCRGSRSLPTNALQVGEKESEMALRLSEMSRELDARHTAELGEKLADAARQVPLEGG